MAQDGWVDGPEPKEENPQRERRKAFFREIQSIFIISITVWPSVTTATTTIIITINVP
jgi:hypothetical protein